MRAARPEIPQDKVFSYLRVKIGLCMTPYCVHQDVLKRTPEGEKNILSWQYHVISDRKSRSASTNSNWVDN